MKKIFKAFGMFIKYARFFWKQRKDIKNWLPLTVHSWVLLLLHYSRISRLDDKQLVLKMSRGFCICVRPDTMAIIDTFGRYCGLMGMKDWKGKTVVDIGAHVGSFAVYAAAEGARVFAFEPDPLNVRCLLKSRELNGFQRHLQAYPAAVAASSGKVDFFQGGHSTVGTIVDEEFFKKRRNPKEKPMAVDAVGINELFAAAGIDGCDVLKLDCEGSEYAIIKAADAGTLNGIKAIILEGHPSSHEGQDFSFIKDKLTAQGFSLVNYQDVGHGCCEAYFAKEKA
ncbi:MAG: FkbM family methyltransferase [Candidatus Omnitrophica bacterium]|nr:FkbM family methyltransferase [Candidatus Omnitrophota bacterium]